MPWGKGILHLGRKDNKKNEMRAGDQLV